MKILTEDQRILLRDERSFLNDLRLALERFGAPAGDQERLAQSIEQLDELFLLVIVGEFNSGKSALINALLGQRLLKEGVTPTTAQINILRYDEAVEQKVEGRNILVIRGPADLLREMSIVDTPGTNAIIREHEAITSEFVPRADMVLFITSVDRPFTESERSFLELIRKWGKKVVVVLNKLDILETQADLLQVEEFVRTNARQLFDIEPEIFPVSAKLALRAKLGEPQYWNPSRFEALESYIKDTLDDSSRLKLKLLNPLGVGLHLVERFERITTERLDMLQEDVNRLQNVDAQLDLYQQDMSRDFDFRMADLENILLAMEQRGQEYFDDTIRLQHIFDLIHKDRIQQEFERYVVADVPQNIEKKVAEMIDWMVEANYRQWQGVHDNLSERQRTHQDRLIGEPAIGTFHLDRQRLIDTVANGAQRVVETYDKTMEAQAIAQSAQDSVAALAAVEVSALSLGALITMLATTAAMDATGIILASVVAVLGLFVIPSRRRQAKEDLRLRMAELRENLSGTLRTHFEHEISVSIQKLRESIEPYTRFVHAERGKLLETQQGLGKVQVGLSDLKVKVETIQ
ncbi:MAG: dynamin family protein [Anaerolineales bacterium]|jgi:small GTP-binding protein|nr:dynamin family protein [Anaerolineales bacterium]